MLTKLLFTLAVVALVVGLVKVRRRPTPVARPARRAFWRMAVMVAGVVVAVMLGGTLVMLWLHWQDRHQVLQVSVIDAATGKATRYRVRRGDLGERVFVTLDGRRVQLADTDRLEVAAEP